MRSIDEKVVNTIRGLSMDAIEKAKSGHPGMPMGSASMAYVLWKNHLKASSSDSNWIDRDRFILSAGHGSMLEYSLLHLFGYKVSMDDIKNFRQLGSNTPGHPEVLDTDGVDMTTGPLGQGISTAVGFAIAETRLAAEFNKEEKLIDHYTYAIAGDGCFQEGISSEAASLAGHLGLAKLIVLYDSNKITIDGSTDIAFTEDVLKRYEAYGWQTIVVEDGNDLEAIDKAILQAKADTERPTLIEVKTVIGYGSPNKSGKSAAHGAPLGAEEIVKTKEFLGLDPAKSFYVEDEVYSHMKEIIDAKANQLNEWNKSLENLKAKNKAEYDRFNSWLDGKFEVSLGDLLEGAKDGDATRGLGGTVLNNLKKKMPTIVGGSADLNGSTKTYLKDCPDYTKENRAGDNIFFGIREFAMAAIANGITLHGGLRAYCSTFFVFSDYMKSAVRLSALMNNPVLYVFTHDSIAVGEDGPTHQPVEHLLMYRSVPNVRVYRPCDKFETAAAYLSAIKHTDGPSVMVLSRQGLPTVTTENIDFEKGAYRVGVDNGENVDGLFIATGSEVHLAVQAQAELAKEGIKVNVVSVLSKEVFAEQDSAYVARILQKDVKNRVIVEAGHKLGMYDYMTDSSKIISMDGFGTSAPSTKVLEKFGFTVQNLLDTFKK